MGADKGNIQAQNQFMCARKGIYTSGAEALLPANKEVVQHLTLEPKGKRGQ